MNYRRWAFGLEWSLLAAVVAVHAGICLGGGWLRENLGSPGSLIVDAAPFTQVALLLLLAIWGPGRIWFRGLALLAAVGWTLPLLFVADQPFVPGHMRQLFLLVAALTFVGAVIARLAGVRVARVPADGSLDRGGAKFSIRGLLVLTTLVAALAAVAGWVRPYLADATLTVDGSVAYQLALLRLESMNEEAAQLHAWIGNVVRPAAMTLGLTITILLAATAVLRPGATWMRLVTLAASAPLLGWYVAYLTASSSEASATFAALFAVVATMMAGSLVPLRLMNYRLLRPARVASLSANTITSPTNASASAPEPCLALPETAR